MKVRLIIVLFEILTVTLLVALVACSSPTYESELTIDQIKARSLSALELIETYRLDMTVSMGISAGSEVTINQLSSINGAIDKTSKKMSLTMETKSTMNPSPGYPNEMEQKAEIYVIGSTMYVKATGPGMPVDWQEEELAETFWLEQDVVAQQIKLLEASEITLVGEEAVSGADCYILDISPNVEEFWEALSEQLGNRSLPELIEPGEIIRSMSVKVWVAQDTFFPMKVRQNASIALGSEDLELPELEGKKEVTMDIDLELTVSDYNKKLPIDLPAELG